VVVGNVTGAALNPARAFGPYLAEWLLGGSNLWWQYPIFVVGPILGALAAAFLYDYVSASDADKVAVKAAARISKKI